MSIALSLKRAERAYEVYEAIVCFLDVNGYPPTMIELARFMGYAHSKSVVFYVNILAGFGLVEIEPARATAWNKVWVTRDHFWVLIKRNLGTYYTTARIKGKETRVRIWIP